MHFLVPAVCWTRPRFENDDPEGPLGPKLSRRDVYIWRRAVVFCERALPHMIAYDDPRLRREADAVDEDHELQAAIAMSLAEATPRSPGAGPSSDNDALAPPSADGHTASTRSLEEAGIPATPGSSRARKKRSGRR